MKKVSIIGSGFVGASTAYALMLKVLPSEIVIIDMDKSISESEMLDIRHGISHMGMCHIVSGDYEDIKDSDLIVISAGRNRKPGETRLDLALDNTKISYEIAQEIKKYYTKGVVLIVANPVDVLTAKYTQWLGLPKGKVLGTGCLLDTSRFVNVLADYFHVNPALIHAQVIGEHGNSQVALWSKVTVDGKNVDEYAKLMGIPLTEDIKDELATRVKNLGAEIIRGKGKTHYGIATCVCYIADAILNNHTAIASVSSVLHGEYGFHDVALSVLSIVGSRGVERVLVDDITTNEYEKLKNSYDALVSSLDMVKDIG